MGLRISIMFSKNPPLQNGGLNVFRQESSLIAGIKENNFVGITGKLFTYGKWGWMT
jgi:hypothetical protein